MTITNSKKAKRIFFLNVSESIVRDCLKSKYCTAPWSWNSMHDRITTEAERKVRPFHPADEADVVGVWHRSGLAAYTYLPTWQALTLETAQYVFHNIIQPKCN